MHINAVAQLWPLVYVAAGALIGAVVHRVWVIVIGRRIAQRWTSLAVATRAIGVALFICVLLIGIYATVLAYEVPEHTLDFVRKLLLAIALGVATYVAGRTAFGLMTFYSRSASGLFPQSSLLSTIAELLMFIIGGLIVLGSMGISIAPLLTALGVGGLAVGLALSAPLSNLFAGLQIVASRELRPNDYVRFDGGVEGWVVDISWNNTTIRDRAESLIVMPNSKVTTTTYTNYDLPSSHLIIEVKATLDLDTDLDKAEREIHECAVGALHSCNEGSFDPTVRFLALTDKGIEFVAFMKVASFVDQFKLRHEFIKRLQQQFRKDPKSIPILTGEA